MLLATALTTSWGTCPELGMSPQLTAVELTHTLMPMSGDSYSFCFPGQFSFLTATLLSHENPGRDGKNMSFPGDFICWKIKVQFSLQRSCRMRGADSFPLVLSARAVLCRGPPHTPSAPTQGAAIHLTHNSLRVWMFPDWCMAPGNKYESTNDVCPPECTVIEAVRCTHYFTVLK